MTKSISQANLLLVTPCLAPRGGIEALSLAVRSSLLASGCNVRVVSFPQNCSSLFNIFQYLLAYILVLYYSFWCTTTLSMHPSLLRFIPLFVFRRAFLTCWIHGIDVWGALPARVMSRLCSYDLLISSSNFTVQKMHHVYPDTQSLPFSVINPSIVRPTLFSTPVYPSNLHLLTVSRLSKAHSYKGHRQIIAALAMFKNPSWRWTVVGSGDDEPHIKMLSNEYGISSRVDFLGDLPDSDLSKLYKECSVFVLPSHFSNPASTAVTGEGFGIVYLEAAMAGKASIAALDGGHTDLIVDGRTGWFVPDQGASSLLSIFEYLSQHPSEIIACGQRARERALSYFTLSNFSEQLFHTLLAS